MPIARISTTRDDRQERALSLIVCAIVPAPAGRCGLWTCHLHVASPGLFRMSHAHSLTCVVDLSHTYSNFGAGDKFRSRVIRRLSFFCGQIEPSLANKFGDWRSLVLGTKWDYDANRAVIWAKWNKFRADLSGATYVMDWVSWIDPFSKALTIMNLIIPDKSLQLCC